MRTLTLIIGMLLIAGCLFSIGFHQQARAQGVPTIFETGTIYPTFIPNITPPPTFTPSATLRPTAIIIPTFTPSNTPTITPTPHPPEPDYWPTSLPVFPGVRHFRIPSLTPTGGC